MEANSQKQISALLSITKSFDHLHQHFLRVSQLKGVSQEVLPSWALQRVKACKRHTYREGKRQSVITVRHYNSSPQTVPFLFT